MKLFFIHLFFQICFSSFILLILILLPLNPFLPLSFVAFYLNPSVLPYDSYFLIHVSFMSFISQTQEKLTYNFHTSAPP